MTKHTAPSFLKAGLQHMEDRAATRDAPTGERSMAKTVAAFNIIYGHNLTEEQGWQFMVLLKQVRGSQGAFNADDYEDAAAYSALAGEAASSERAPRTGPQINGVDLSKEADSTATLRTARKYRHTCARCTTLFYDASQLADCPTKDCGQRSFSTAVEIVFDPT